MKSIERIEASNGYKILTGTASTDLSSFNPPIVKIVIRSPGATIAALEVGDASILAARGLTGVALDVTDVPISAGQTRQVKGNTTKIFNLIQLTDAADSVSLIFGDTDA